MQAIQLKFQKILSISCLVLASGMILYALSFSTDLYLLSYHSNPGSALFYVPGAEVYQAAQPFNRAFFGHSVLYFLVCLFLFLTLTHRRRLYYFSNYAASLVMAAASVALGAELFANARRLREMFLLVDFVRLKEVTGMMNMTYSESTFVLDLGIVLSVLLFIAALLLCLNLALKTVWMRREQWLEEVDAA